MATKQSLLEFQRQLLEKLKVAPTTATLNALLGFELGQSAWLVSLTEISEVIPCPPIETVPMTKNWLLGAANYRGQVFSVVDLAQFFGEAPATLDSSARLLIVERRIVAGCGLLVPKVLGLRNPSSLEEVSGYAPTTPWAKTRRHDSNGRAWLELDLRRLAADATFHDVAA
jgi:twitching motility protein PilI